MCKSDCGFGASEGAYGAEIADAQYRWLIPNHRETPSAEDSAQLLQASRKEITGYFVIVNDPEERSISVA